MHFFISQASSALTYPDVMLLPFVPFYLAAQLPSKWNMEVFNFGSLGYRFPLSNGREKGESCISYD